MPGLMSSSKGKIKTVTIYDGKPNNYSVNINVKNIIPDKYKKLSKENFGITYTRINTPYGAITDSNRGPYINTYNSDTGILNITTSGSSLEMSALTVKAWYI